MPEPGAIERKVQTRIIRLFTEQLGYEYLGNWQDREDNQPMDEIIRKTRKADWRGDLIKEREVKRAIRGLVTDPKQVEKVFELAKNQPEY